ncbi:hypothetical protein TSUD_153130 [Trifolium subterraneum]|uniref:HAT C-terminal dimerisation domain-containing protein n=1 Tax=Trifolium subterraneum TaxID=3900 RepID=A0A2Z6MIA7_TRISU|nr:hypothetical protein TSUD_153130 [Trifolium subterraneum]
MYLDLDKSMSVNSTYLMLESAHKDAFKSFHLYDHNYKLCPSVEEWKRVEKICAFLLPFCQTASIINSSTAHPTSNLYFLQVWKVQCVLVECLGVEDEGIKRMAERMMSKIEKYCYSCIGSGSRPTDKVVKIGLSLKTHHQQLIPETGMSQLDIYLDESNLSFHLYEDLDVLQWWKRNNDRFPDLSILACDLLSVPMTTVASTRDFCMGYRVFNKYKDRKLPRNMDARFCTRSWLYNFGSNDGDDNEDSEGIMIEIDHDDVMDDSNFEDDDDGMVVRLSASTSRSDSREAMSPMPSFI